MNRLQILARGASLYNFRVDAPEGSIEKGGMLLEERGKNTTMGDHGWLRVSVWDERC